MKIKPLIPALITFLAGLFIQVTSVCAQPLGDKLSLARYLLENQSTSESLKGQTRYGFGLDASGELGYTLKNAAGETVQAYMQQGSLRLFFVEFYENGFSQKELQQKLTALNYVWVGTEKSCDYLNNGSLAVTLCPPSDKGVRICVNLMPH